MRSRTKDEPVGAEAARLQSMWSQRVGAFSAVPALVRELGGDPAQVLVEAGIDPAVLERPNERIPYGSMGRLLAEAARATALPHFGLLAGRVWRLADLGLVGELVRHSPSLGHALQSLVVHHHVNTHGGTAFLIQRAGMVDLGYAVYMPGVPGSAEIDDAHLAAGMNFLRELAGPGFNVSEVLIAHEPPADLRPYRSTFNLLPRFNAEFCALRFSRQWLQRAIEGADPVKFAAAEAQAHANQPDLVQQIYRTLRKLMLENRHSGDDVADVLMMHRRTLNRRLKLRGLTFQQVLDDVRYGVARKLLADSRVSLDDIAETLGYAGISPFMRSFHRWSGMTPGRWREAARHGGLALATAQHAAAEPASALKAQAGSAHERSDPALAGAGSSDAFP